MIKQLLIIAFVLISPLAGCRTANRDDAGENVAVKNQRDLLPAQVRKGFEAAFPGATVQSAHRDEVSGNWSIRFIDATGQWRRAEFDSTGRWDRNAALP